MTVRVIGAGLPRTGTHSSKEALQRLLDAPCYHMSELMVHLDQAPVWLRALRGDPPDWRSFLSGYAAALDWPVTAFWRELAETYPDALVLLTYRDTGADWYASMARTVLPMTQRWADDEWWRQERAKADPNSPFVGATREQQQAFQEIFRLFRAGLPADDPDSMAAYHDRFLAEVRAEVPAERLVDLRTGEGWEPLCAALGVPAPDEPYPHVNSSQDWAARARARGWTS